MRLTREVTFWISLADLQRTEVPACQGDNSWVGYPSPEGVGFPFHFACELQGPVDRPSGMVINVHDIDRRLRTNLWPVVLKGLRHSDPSYESLLLQAREILLPLLPAHVQLKGLTFYSSPRLRYTMTDVRQFSYCEQFEFSASHRLFNPDWTGEKNEQVFGKCSRPGGHGHNYLLEVCVAGRLNGESTRVVAAHDFESVVKSKAVSRLDHRNLDTDVAELKGRPSTAENIAQVVFDWLATEFTGVELQSVRIWETPRTFAECRAAS